MRFVTFPRVRILHQKKLGQHSQRATLEDDTKQQNEHKVFKKKKRITTALRGASSHRSRQVSCCMHDYTPQVVCSGVVFWNKTSALELMKYTATNESRRNPIPTVKVSTCNSNQHQIVCQKKNGHQQNVQMKKQISTLIKKMDKIKQ